MKRFISGFLSIVIAVTSMVFCFPVTASAADESTVNAIKAADNFIVTCGKYFVDHWDDPDNPYIRSTFGTVHPECMMNSTDQFTAYIGIIPDSLTYHGKNQAATYNSETTLRNTDVKYDDIANTYKGKNAAADSKSVNYVHMTTYGINPNNDTKTAMSLDTEGIFLPYTKCQANLHSDFLQKDIVISGSGTKEEYAKHYVHGTLGVYLCNTVDKKLVPILACPLYIWNSLNDDYIGEKFAHLLCTPDVTWIDKKQDSAIVLQAVKSASVDGLDVLLLAARLHELAKDEALWAKIGAEGYKDYIAVAEGCSLEDDPITLFMTVTHVKGAHDSCKKGADDQMSNVYQATSGKWTASAGAPWAFNWVICASIAHGFLYGNFKNSALTNSAENAISVITNKYKYIGESTSQFKYFNGKEELDSKMIGFFNTACTNLILSQGVDDYQNADELYNAIKTWYSTWMTAVGSMGVRCTFYTKSSNDGIPTQVNGDLGSTQVYTHEAAANMIWNTYAGTADNPGTYRAKSEFFIYAYRFMSEIYVWADGLKSQTPEAATTKTIEDYNTALELGLAEVYNVKQGEHLTFAEVLTFINSYDYKTASDANFTKLQRTLFYLSQCTDFKQKSGASEEPEDKYEDFRAAISQLRSKLSVSGSAAETLTADYIRTNDYRLYVHRIAFDHAKSIASKNTAKNVFRGAHVEGAASSSVYEKDSYLYLEVYDERTLTLDTVYYQDLLMSYLAVYNYDTGNGNDATQRGKTLSLRSEILLQLASSGCLLTTLRENSEKYKDLLSVIDMCDTEFGNLPAMQRVVTGACYLSIDPNKNTRQWLLIDKAGDYFYYLLELLSELQCITTAYVQDFILIANLTDVTNYADLSESISVLDNMCSVGMNLDCSMSRDALYTPVPSITRDGDEDTSAGLSLMNLRTILMEMGLLTADDYSLLEGSDDQPLTYFWKLDYGSLNLNGSWLKGRALSSTYIPMQSNSYDPYTMFDLMDTDWIKGYHYRWGFYRKALFIDTNTDAAQDYYVTGNKGTLRVAKLEDLLHPESDIVLYIDDDLYNTQTLAELQDKTYGLYTDSEQKEGQKNIFTGFVYWLTHLNSVSMENIVKTDQATTYSTVVKSKTSPMSWRRYDSDGNPQPGDAYDDFLLAGDEIGKTLSEAEDYSVMVSFAIISSIYRDADNFQKIYDICTQDRPVFVSSSTVATLSSATDTMRSTMYNYALLKNLHGMTTVGYETSIDMTSPLYMDIYGNIVCESGLVVVPAACNATLHNAERDYMPSCIGFMATYGKEWKIPGDWNIDTTFMEKFFKLNPDTNEWDIRPRTILGTNMNWAQLSYSSKDVQEALMDWYYYDLVNANIINKELTVQCMHEVIRGAPLEYIDLNEEGLGTVQIDKAGLNAAAKLDAIIDALDWDGENSILNTPTLAFLEHYDLIVTIIFKVLLIIIVIALMITIFNDVIKQKFSWRTVGSCLLTITIGAGSVVLIPVAFDISYYQSNKLLLQNEAEYIMMYNMEKNMSGVEVGVTNVNEYNQNTDIYLKLSSYEFEWWKHLDKVIFGDSVAVMKEEYQNYLNSQFLSGYDLIELKNNGAYVAVQNIFNTSTLNYDTLTKCLYQKVSVDPVVSFYSPYYLFLDALLADMNDYNLTHDIYAYSTKIMRGGQVKTVNLCNAYFSSPEFMEGNYDYLGLIQLYGVQEQVQPDPIFEDSRLESCINSSWYVGGLLNNDENVKRVDKMHHYLRQFVADNRHLIGKVTDETFIKAMAMSAAVYYNNLYGVANANAYEIYNLSNSDLMRLSITDKATTLETSPMSFARFAYNETGAFGTYASVFLVISTMFTAFAKAILTVGLFALLVVSIYVQKILLRGKNHPLGGYCITLLVICSTNVLYALLLKVSLLLPNLGITPSICIILQILVQLGYVFVLLCVLIFALRDWRNIGMSFYQPIVDKASKFVKNRTVNNPRFNKYAAVPRGPKHIDASDFGSTGAQQFAESNYSSTVNHETRGELKRKKTGNQNLN